MEFDFDRVWTRIAAALELREQLFEIQAPFANRRKIPDAIPSDGVFEVTMHQVWQRVLEIIFRTCAAPELDIRRIVVETDVVPPDFLNYLGSFFAVPVTSP